MDKKEILKVEHLNVYLKQGKEKPEIARIVCPKSMVIIAII